MSLKELGTSLLAGAPPSTVTGMYLLGYPLQAWVVVLNFVWVLLLVLHKLYTIIKGDST